MSSALQIQDQAGTPSIAAAWRTAGAIKAQREAIVQLMRDVMKDGIDYGTIPGTPKPTLYKPGSEKLISMFRLATKVEAEDLSTPDTIRYRVRITVTEQSTGMFLGEGLGEASSAETKYQWRKIVCQEEWDETPEDRRRKKWAKSKEGPYSVFQVRAEMEDVANTVLKMAKKRAQIDATLTVTAASDVFSQDAADLKEAGIELGAEETAAAAPPAQELTRKVDPAPTTQQQPVTAPVATQTQSPQQGGALTTEAQQRRFYAIWNGAKRTKDEVKQYLGETFGIDSDREMLAKDYDKACAWAARK